MQIFIEKYLYSIIFAVIGICIVYFIVLNCKKNKNILQDMGEDGNFYNKKKFIISVILVLLIVIIETRFKGGQSKLPISDDILFIVQILCFLTFLKLKGIEHILHFLLSPHIDNSLVNKEDIIKQYKKQSKSYWVIKDDIEITKDDVIQGFKLVGIILFFVSIFIGVMVLCVFIFDK